MEATQTTDEMVEPAQVEAAPLADGTVIDGTDGQEKIVHDLDEAGNVVGWHKEII